MAEIREGRMRKHQGWLSLGVIVLVICFVIAIIVGGQSISKPINGLNSPLVVSTTRVQILNQPINLNNPTTVMPPEGTPTIYHFANVYDLAPNLDQYHKSYDVIQRTDGTYDQYWHDPTDFTSVKALLKPGDKIVDHAGPQILMMVYPPTTTPATQP
jgi:hypothetical protein